MVPLIIICVIVGYFMITVEPGPKDRPKERLSAPLQMLTGDLESDPEFSAKLKRERECKDTCAEKHKEVRPFKEKRKRIIECEKDCGAR